MTGQISYPDWIEWKGGECPAPGQRVIVGMRGAGEMLNPVVADELEWRWASGSDPRLIRLRRKFDIVSYKVVG